MSEILLLRVHLVCFCVEKSLHQTTTKKSGYEKFVWAFEKVDPHSAGRAFESDPLFLLMGIIDHGLEIATVSISIPW